MNNKAKKPDFRTLILISDHKLAKHAEAILSEANAPMQYHILAMGTASNEIIDMLGLGSTDRSVIITTLTKPCADEMLTKMHHQLYLGTPNSGVAFTMPVSGGSASLLNLLQAMEESNNVSERDSDIMDNKYTMIMAFVDQGYSDEVMMAARPAGAKGGTVFHSRHVGSKEAEHHWGISVQEEREIVIILAEREKKLDIMKAIGEKCGAQTDAHGIVISTPVDSVVGLYKDEG